MRGLLAAVLGCAACWGLPASGQTPAEIKVANAQKRAQAASNRADAFADLALALAQRARETADPEFYDRADRAAAQALELEPDHLAARRAQVWIRLGKHEFADALVLAQALNRRVPDDAMTYAFLVDANAELGNYAQAEDAAQWLLNLRPGAVPGLTRAAYLREMFGDIEGALELMRQAYQRLPPAELEERAWTLTQIAHLELVQGKVERAELAATEALRLFPGYHYALGQLARVRSAQARQDEAVELERRRFASAPHPENLFELGKALQRSGRHSEAKRAFGEFEQRARTESQQWDNANRELVYYYVDFARRAGAALRVAEIEIARRHDVLTRVAYAWALHAAGRNAQARREIEAALAVGVRDPEMLYRAGAIALANGDRQAAREYFRRSLAASPRSEVAAHVERLLLRTRVGGVVGSGNASTLATR